jgi:hypothetical protein
MTSNNSFPPTTAQTSVMGFQTLRSGLTQRRHLSALAQPEEKDKAKPFKGRLVFLLVSLQVLCLNTMKNVRNCSPKFASPETEVLGNSVKKESSQLRLTIAQTFILVMLELYCTIHRLISVCTVSKVNL